MRTKITKQAKAVAHQLRLPPYFFEGQIALSYGSLDQLVIDWQSFAEAIVHNDRIIVLHKTTSPNGWIISDFLTGVQVVQAGTKLLVWKKFTELSDWGKNLHKYPEVNSLHFQEAYWQILSTVKKASPIAKQAMLCACRDIATGAIDY